MVDKISLDQDALDLICNRATDGAEMIATCRAIFSAEYGDQIHNSGLLDIFQVICDESDYIVLNGFGRFNALIRTPKSDKNALDFNEINKIYEFYLQQFEAATDKFRKHFGLS